MGEQQERDEKDAGEIGNLVGRLIYKTGPKLVHLAKVWTIPVGIGFTLGGGAGNMVTNWSRGSTITSDTIRVAVETAIAPLVTREFAHEVKDSLYRDSVALAAQNRPQPRRYGPRRVDHAGNTPPMLPLAQNQRREP